MHPLTLTTQIKPATKQMYTAHASPINVLASPQNTCVPLLRPLLRVTNTLQIATPAHAAEASGPGSRPGGTIEGYVHTRQHDTHVCHARTQLGRQ